MMRPGMEHASEPVELEMLDASAEDAAAEKDRGRADRRGGVPPQHSPSAIRTFLFPDAAKAA
eukprot:4441888-Pyramimonas_sp.AAC.2